jgi:hypothetical protein
LYFVGLASAFSFGPVMRFVFGAKHAAAILTAHLRAAGRTPSERSRGRSERHPHCGSRGPTGDAPPVRPKGATIGLLSFDNARISTRGSGWAQDVDVDHEEARRKA